MTGWKLNAVRTILSVAVFLSPSIASADYEVFSINPIPADQAVSLTLQYQMIGHGSGERFDTLYVADSKVTAFDRLTIPLCRYLGENGGQIDLEIRTTSTSSPIVASSTLVVNSGNVWSIGCTSVYINATTSTFVLNNNVQWEIGSNIWFSFYPRGTSGTFYYSFKMDGSNGNPNYNNNNNIGLFSGKTYNFSAKGYALGIPPTSTYTASSTGVVCRTFDIGCYLSNAFAFLFIPSTAVIQNFTNTTIQNEFPFSYWYSMQNAFDSAISSSTDQFFVVDFEIMGSTSTILSYPMIQDLVGDDSLDLIRNIFEWILWLCFGFYIYIHIKSIWS